MSEPTSLRSNKPIWMRGYVWAFTSFAVTSVLCPFFWDMNSPTIPSVIFLASVAALCSGMGFWLGFGGSVRRFAAVTVGLCFLTFLMTTAFGYVDPIHMGLFCFMATVMVGAPIATIRILWRGQLALDNDNRDSSNSREVLRFSIWQVLVFMTLVAVPLAIAKATIASMPVEFVNEIFRIGGVGATLGICSVVVVWATLGRQPLARSIVSCVSAIGLGMVNGFVMDRGGPIASLWVGITLIVWLEMTILISLVRREGYRFVTIDGQ